MAQSANYSPDYSFEDNRAHALALHDLDLTASLVRALAGVMKEAREAAGPENPATHLFRRTDRARGAGQGLSAIMDAAFPRQAAEPQPKRKTPSRMTKAERVDYEARLAMRRTALEELKADSARLLAEREARKVAELAKAGQ